MSHSLESKRSLIDQPILYPYYATVVLVPYIPSECWIRSESIRFLFLLGSKLVASDDTVSGQPEFRHWLLLLPVGLLLLLLLLLHTSSVGNLCVLFFSLDDSMWACNRPCKYNKLLSGLKRKHHKRYDKDCKIVNTPIIGAYGLNMNIICAVVFVRNVIRLGTGNLYWAEVAVMLLWITSCILDRVSWMTNKSLHMCTTLTVRVITAPSPSAHPFLKMTVCYN